MGLRTTPTKEPSIFKKNKNHQVSWEHFPGFSDSPNRSCNAQEKEEKVATILVMLVEV
jgi:hypothetical protein